MHGYAVRRRCDWGVQGRNRLYLHALDKEHYCIVIYLAQQRTDSEVRAMMHAPETTDEALSRVQQKVLLPLFPIPWLPHRLCSLPKPMWADVG